MSDSILKYEEKMWLLFENTKNEMPALAEAYYGPVKDAVYKDGSLDIKTKRLMSLAVAVQAGCKDCMISQTTSALERGATLAEIFETCAVVIRMGTPIKNFITPSFIVFSYKDFRDIESRFMFPDLLRSRPCPVRPYQRSGQGS